MATSSSQDGGRKKRKSQRPLIAPALPLNLKPKPTPTNEPAPAPPTPNNATGNQDTSTIGAVAVAQEPEAGVNASPISEQQGSLNNVSQTVDTGPNDPSGEQASATSDDSLSKHVVSGNHGEDNSRSSTPKASSRAELSNTQSPASGSASAEPRTDGISSETLQNLSASIEHLNFQPGQGGSSASNTTGEIAQEPNTVMPQRYFSSEEPILDWADEMSEEMHPDTLHIPPVPHLPELSSDSMAPQGTIIQTDTDYSAQVQPPMPIFGSAAAQELQSEGITAETPKHDGQHLTNGYSHTPEPKAVATDYSMTPYQTVPAPTPLQNGHVRGVSQSFVPRGPIPDITTHLTKLWETRDLADWTIQVILSNGTYPPVAYPTHGVVISRSEVLRYLMGLRLHARPMTPIVILSPPRYVLPPAFEAALKYLYNEGVLTPEECARYFTFSGDNTSATVKIYQLDFSFSYWLSGHILGLSAVVEAGLTLLKEYLDWDTAELMIKESLEVKNASAAQHFLPTPNSAGITPSTMSDPSSPLSSRQKRTAATGIDELEILGVLVDCMAKKKLEVDLSKFKLDTGSSSVLRSYLPDVEQYTKSHRALSSITFGSLPTTTPSIAKTHTQSSQPVFSSNSVDDAQTFSPAERALSAILLNVPFTELNELLSGLLQTFAENDVLDLFTKVLHEREVRRARVAESEWYRAEALAKRRLHQVDCTEQFVRDGKQSYLVSRLKE
jgi:hypothetical protein